MGKIVRINVTPEIKKEAQERNEAFKKKYGNRGTHRLDKNRQRETGYLAEAAINSYCKNLSYSDDDKVDFIMNDSTIDSKAQGCNVEPKGYFAATLYEDQKNREVDFYIFSRVKNDSTAVWICGVISKEEFFTRAKLIKAGTKNNNFTYDQSRYELTYNDLTSIKEWERDVSTR